MKWSSSWTPHTSNASSELWYLGVLTERKIFSGSFFLMKPLQRTKLVLKSWECRDGISKQSSAMEDVAYWRGFLFLFRCVTSIKQPLSRGMWHEDQSSKQDKNYKHWWDFFRRLMRHNSHCGWDSGTTSGESFSRKELSTILQADGTSPIADFGVPTTVLKEIFHIFLPIFNIQISTFQIPPILSKESLHISKRIYVSTEDFASIRNNQWLKSSYKLSEQCFSTQFCPLCHIFE